MSIRYERSGGTVGAGVVDRVPAHSWTRRPQGLKYNVRSSITVLLESLVVKLQAHGIWRLGGLRMHS